jgi:uncharacterized heparinase superfamily protein
MASSLLPSRHAVAALGVAASRRVRAEWTGLGAFMAPRPRTDGFCASPRDLRPPDVETGRKILAGAFVLAGDTLAVGPRGDPWDRASPSRRFATALHRFAWAPGLLAAGPDGAAEALRLTLEWLRLFGRANAFSWSPEVLERRVFNLACVARPLCVRASDAETQSIADSLARQAHALLALDAGPARAAERAVAAAVAGASLLGVPGHRLLERALKALAGALPQTVESDGGHATRNPQSALELLFDLMTLDDTLLQRGLAAPDEMLSAVDRLTAVVRFFTLADGKLAAFQGGDELDATYVAAARAQDDFSGRATPVARNGYQRLEGRSLQIVADAAAPARGAWSLAACGQPLAMEVLAGRRRLIVGSGWSPDAHGPQAMRLDDAHSSVTIGDAPCGEPLRGYPARVLGPRLVNGAKAVDAKRHEAPGALWLELAHDGFVERFGLRHERRLYIDIAADELRGEDRLTHIGPAGRAGGRKFVPFMVRFHLAPDVSALIARDKKSVLLKPEGHETGWWLRNDALEVAIEPSVHYHNGLPRRSQQIVLRGQARLETGASVRWKLSAAAASAPPPAAAVDAGEAEG